MIDPARWVPLAEVARPHGVRGELRLKVYNSDSDILLGLDEVLVRLPDGGGEYEVSIDSARRADQAILMRLHSVETRERADEIRGAVLCARRGDFPPLEPGEFYACDVAGAKAFLDGAEIGTVRELRSYPSIDALVIDAADGGKPYEIPLVEAFVKEVDAAAGKVVLATIEGIERG